MSRGKLRADAPLALLLALPLCYLGFLALLWTVGNNDPLHTRFLQPVYAFGLLLFAHLYVRARESESSRADALPFQALYALTFALQVAAWLQAVGSGVERPT